MDGSEFQSVEPALAAFHAEFAPAFGRRPCQKRSQDYLRGLLALRGERGNAENLAEATTASPRALQRFLTDARWCDQAVLERLHRYLAPQLNHPEAVWAVDETGLPKQGQHSVGVARQYCGALGKVAGCQVGVFLAHLGPGGRALVDKRLYLPEGWTQAPDRCAAAQIPPDCRVHRSKPALALALLQQARAWGHLQADWVTGDDAYGQDPAFRAGVAAGGWHYVLEIPGHTPTWPVHPTSVTAPYRGRGRRPQPQPVPAERQTARERAAALPPTAWQAYTVGEGAQGPRCYEFACEAVRETRDRQPGELLWLVHKRNLDGTEPRTFYAHAPPDTPPATLARVAMSRWPIETAFEDGKSRVALDEYEVRGWPGWHHHLTMVLLACAFLLHLQQEWGKKAAGLHPTPGAPGGRGVLGRAAPHPDPTVRLGRADPTGQSGGPPEPPTAAGAGCGGAGQGQRRPLSRPSARPSSACQRL